MKNICGTFKDYWKDNASLWWITEKGKRLDMHLESSVYKFMFNLEINKVEKYPSHIM